jgi:phosphopantetheinyl transferase (holo-ACP synthase)
VTVSEARPSTLALRRPGYWIVVDAQPSEGLATVYLSPAEWEDYRSHGSAARPEWLLGRVVVKDAVCQWLWERGAGPLLPHDVRVWNEPGGRPRVSVPGGRGLHVSLAHRRGVAVAVVGPGLNGTTGGSAGGPGAPDAPAGSAGDGGFDEAARHVGVDVELVEPRSATFAGLMMRAPEAKLGIGRPRDEWLTAVWTAKEAVAKADGTGLRGRPKDWAVQAVDGDWLLVDGRWVETTREGDLVVGTVRRR